MVRLRGRGTAVAEREPVEEPAPPAGDPDAVVPVRQSVKERPSSDRNTTVRRLGDLLVERGSVSGSDLQDALLEQTESGRRLGDVLLELGMIDEVDLLQALSEQSGLPVSDLRRVAPSTEALAALSEAIVRSALALPIEIDDDSLTVAMGAPPSPDRVAELSQSAGRQVRVVLAPASQIQVLIDRSYRALIGLDELVEAFDGAAAARTNGAAPVALSVDESAPVAQLVSRILTEAVRERASDVHLEPQEDAVRVRFRVDGALHDAVVLPGSMTQALVSRIKIMAEMNIVERRRSQDGQIEITVDGRSLDVRVATMATIWGEKVVLRILDKKRSLLELSRLGMSAETEAEFSRLVRAPFGMVLCAGPTGSGKTTTLYAVLNQIASSERNVTTIEDPVEYVFPSINQIQINEQADITFAGGLKGILRQDPDVILVGEIRDVETARIAVQSALTGHLVLSSLHATDATSALHRFLDMGIEAFLVSSSVIGVVAQRLVRRICDSCRQPQGPTATERAIYDEWGGKPKGDFTQGVGCNFCANTGFVDRVGVYELMRVSPAIKQLIVRQGSHDELRDLAISEGMRTLRDEALRLVEEDITTIGEVLRSVYIA
jgi:type IV pilus assembly protein PilB